MFEFHQEHWIDREIEAVFDFFSQAGNLKLLTPDFIGLELLNPEPIEMKEGTLIDYRMRIRGLPMRWQSRIDTWQPPYCFEDTQTKGPYRYWCHTHRFQPVNGGTQVFDTIRYRIWGGRLIDRWFVRPDIQKIFDFRTEQLKKIFSQG